MMLPAFAAERRRRYLQHGTYRAPAQLSIDIVAVKVCFEELVRGDTRLAFLAWLLLRSDIAIHNTPSY